MITASEQKMLDTAYTYHAPTPEKQETYVLLRETAKALAEAVILHAPIGRERSVALTKIEEAVMWANAAIARS